MGKFKPGGFGGAKKKLDGDHGRGRDERAGGRPQMHRATCSECGRSCELPFRPTGDKPVFCSFCFGKKEESGTNRFEKKSFAQSDRGDKTMFKTICAKCHKECEVPFRPRVGKDIFCDNCFGKGDKNFVSSASSTNEQFQKQFDTLNTKLDSILKLLASGKMSKETVVEVIGESVDEGGRIGVNKKTKNEEKKSKAEDSRNDKKPADAKEKKASKEKVKKTEKLSKKTSTKKKK